MGQRLRGPNRSLVPHQLEVWLDRETFDQRLVPWLQSDQCTGYWKLVKTRHTRCRRLRFACADSAFACKMIFG